jgi:XTP/dITP diphosphohydrolase
MELVIATLNSHKFREFKELFKIFPKIELVSLRQFPNYQSPEETGNTFQENATLKAEHAAHHLNQWVLADDSGLSVPALQGAPGIYSRRYAGSQATDAENRQLLLKNLAGLEDFARSAYFTCCLALAAPTGLKKCVTGICEGRILDSERGRNGFGYDAIFIKHDYDKTFAELDEQIKNRISHRYKAFERLKNYLETLQ